MSLRVFVTTSDRYLWALRPFAHLFNRYWSELQPVVVAGYSRPPFQLPPNFSFYQISPENYPANRWSDGVIKFLQAMPDEHFIWLLEDMWLVRTVDVRAIGTLTEYAQATPDLVRLDLTADRLYAGGMADYAYYGSIDLVWSRPSSPYHLSLQAAIWRRELLLNYLIPGETPWELEFEGTTRLSRDEQVHVLGTRQYPVRYSLTLKSEAPMTPMITGMRLSDIEEMKDLGYLPYGYVTP